MGSYINVNIDDLPDPAIRLVQVRRDADLEFWKREAERLREMLENIPAAIEDWGYVEITRRGEETVTLIRKPDDEVRP